MAARAIRRSGYGGTGVADIMKEAGLTHGAFYAHFASRDAMLAEAAGKACAESCAAVADVVAKAPPGMVLQAMLAAYLSKEHVQRAEVGCPWRPWVPDLAPGAGGAPRGHGPHQGNGRSHRPPITGLGTARCPRRALVTLSTMVGSLLLARAVDDPALSDNLREAALKHLAPASQ